MLLIIHCRVISYCKFNVSPFRFLAPSCARSEIPFFCENRYISMLGWKPGLGVFDDQGWEWLRAVLGDSQVVSLGPPTSFQNFLVLSGKKGGEGRWSHLGYAKEP